jgi:hypothetical protein
MLTIEATDDAEWQVTFSSRWTKIFAMADYQGTTTPAWARVREVNEANDYPNGFKIRVEDVSGDMIAATVDEPIVVFICVTDRPGSRDTE